MRTKRTIFAAAVYLSQAGVVSAQQCIDHSYGRHDRAAARVLNERGEILLVREHNRTHPDGLLDLPGGTVENMESTIGAATRELKEETGMGASSCSYVETVNEMDALDGHYDVVAIFNCTVCNTWRVLPQSTLSGAYVGWYNRSELHASDVRYPHVLGGTF